MYYNILNRVLESIKHIWSYVIDHPVEVAGLIVAYFSLILPIRQYLNQRKLDERDKRFNNYHRLIKELVGPDGTVLMDRQIAVVFELRNYPEYYDVSKRILLGCRNSWSNTNQSLERLIQEIDYTIIYIDKKNRV